jgi:hypothetical protein
MSQVNHSQIFAPIAFRTITAHSSEDLPSKLVREIYLEREKQKILFEELISEKKKSKELENYISNLVQSRMAPLTSDLIPTQIKSTGSTDKKGQVRNSHVKSKTKRKYKEASKLLK